ncbi:MAG: DNA replication and repair protein RecF [candidate division WOR-3 bacterium]
MFLEILRCKNFRNFREIELVLPPGRILIVGNNGVGKTNLIEMVYFLSVFSSFRTSNIENLLCFGKPYFVVSGIYGDTEIKISYSKKREIFINDLPQKSLKESFGKIPVVALTNKDLVIIDEEPSKRRHLIDLSISLYNRNYLNYLYEYRRVKKQRNSLLLEAKNGKEMKTLEIWNKQLIKFIYPIIEERKIFLEKLSDYTEKFFEYLCGEKVKIKYIPGGDYSDIENQLKKNIKKEIEMGYTLFGPHRDDIEIKINNKDAKGVLSFGMKKLLISSLKFAISYILKETRKQEPILVIDEMLDGLDRKNADSLWEILSEFNQVFITTTENTFKKEGNYNLYKIEEKDGTPIVRRCAEKIYSI